MKTLIAALLLSSTQGLSLDKLNNQQLLEELMTEGSSHHYHTHVFHHTNVYHHHHHALPSVKEITKKKLEEKIKEKCADPKQLIERKEKKILEKAVQEVQKIKEEIPAPEEAPIEVDNRSVIQKAHDRASEKLTFQDWQDNQNKKEMNEYLKNPEKYSADENAEEIADEKHEEKEKQKDRDVKLQKKILKKIGKAEDKTEKKDLKKQKKDLFEQARDASNEKERKEIIAEAAKILPAKPQTVEEAEQKGKEKIAQAIKATSFGEAAAKPVPETPEAPVSTAQISADHRISADEFVYSDNWTS